MFWTDASVDRCEILGHNGFWSTLSFQILWL